jgi:hypothetical protein
MLREIYHALPLPKEFRFWLAGRLPLRWKRQPQFRDYGTINELYLWRLDRDIDTVVPMQNYFSFLFPELDTATSGTLWIHDRRGLEVARRDFALPRAGIHLARISEIVDRTLEYGTLMWHIRMPDSVAAQDAVRQNLVYFTDRGYLCYEKAPNQPCFVHGVDRYAVFQKQDSERYGLFYPETGRSRAWLAEFPLRHGMQEEIEIVLLNRSSVPRQFSVTVHQNGGREIHRAQPIVDPRGVALASVNADIFARLDGRDGYFLVDGIPTQWGRPAIMRHFAGGAMSAMHC